MASVINTNINSITAQKNLGVNQMSLSTSMQRLSSGLRINSAKDDAAGLAISDRFTSQIRGLDQASRNANDGISLAQTAEGALAQMTDNLQRIRELAVQSANSTNSASDRAALDQEVQQRLAEIDRVASQTQFNGLNILDGSFGNSAFQVGANVGQTISVDLSTSMRTSTIGRRADYVDGTTTFNSARNIGAQGAGIATGAGALAAGDITISVGNGTSVSVGAALTVTAAQTLAGQTNNSAYNVARTIEAAGVSGLSVEADTSATVAWSTTTAADTYTINGVAIAVGSGATFSDFVTLVNANAGGTGVTATYSGGNMTLRAVDGRDISVTRVGTSGANGGLGAFAGNNNTANAAIDFGVAGPTVAKGTVRLSANERVTIGGTTPANAGYAAGTLSLGASALNSASVTSVTNANSAINSVDSALSSVSTLRSTFGAIQNRFESVIANLGTAVENLSASRSRVLDADFAKETANLSRSQILQQAGTAMVAQANQLPQGVLALLR
jgi:flagellin